MAFFYEKEGIDTLLIYQLENSDIKDSFCYGMLENNKIERIAPINFSQNNDVCYFKFNISSKVSATKFFEKEIRRNEILTFFKNIITAIMEAQEYMILPTSFVTDLNYIFIDSTTYEVSLICLPLVKNEYNTDLSIVFKKLLFTSHFYQYENGDYVVKLISYLNSTPNFSLNDFNKLVDELLNPSEYNVTYGQPKPESVPSANSSPNMVNIQKADPPKVENTLKVNIASREDKLLKAGTIPQQNNNVPPIPTTNQSIIPSVNKASNSAMPNNTVLNKEDQVSLLKLLCHYSKENKEKYSIQKKEKKASKQKGKKEQSNQMGGMDFQIPGSQQPMMPSNKPMTSASNPSIPMNYQSTATNYQSMTVNRPNANNPNLPPVANNQSFGNTTVLSQPNTAGQTTVLSEFAATRERPYLVRRKNSEKIYLTNNEFKIGKERNSVDYCIDGNSAISRTHAMIIQRAEEFFIVDMNSTNHTFINGKMINSSQELKLSHNDIIRLANEEFVFNMI
ncbi:MAG: DUF6382 domain-containing protein [Clostridiales bacterium]|nr:DUF6382 domain-containing protein [Clostridiales bacterium]